MAHFSESIDCINFKDDPTGSQYRGFKDTTKSGIVCQKWTSQSPKGHDITPQK